MPTIKTEGDTGAEERGNEGPSDLLTVAPPAAANSTPPVDYEKLMEQLKEMNDKIEQLSVRVERADSERRSAATNEHILSQLQCFMADGCFLTAVTEQIRQQLTTMVVPAIERICAQLFKQLNDNFRHGLDQYLQQMRALQTATLAAVAATATPAPSLSVGADRQALAHMIKNNQIPLAFETVSIHDSKGREFSLSSRRKIFDECFELFCLMAAFYFA
ncbi:hypothetical protein OSTOST_16879, partial [Ostertagia ostertagi]